ncbi:MAG: hypothetical protein ACRDV1_15065 [Actinomycetes bacterium]
MPVRRLLAALAVIAVSSVGLVAAPAVAGPYGPHTGSLTVSKTSIKQGESVRASGDRFCSNARVTVTVTEDGSTYIRKTIRAGSAGRASTTLRLTHLGSNIIKFSGCRKGGGTQVLSAKVRVSPYYGSAYVNDSRVNQGQSVKVWAYKFCRNASVKVTTYDDGRAYKSKTIRANGDGKATTWVKMSRAGQAMIAMSGCHRGGGTQVKKVNVWVRASGTTGSGNATVGGSSTGTGSDNASAGSGIASIARTGGNLTPLWAGLGLLLTGGVLVGATRHRRRVTS